MVEIKFTTFPGVSEVRSCPVCGARNGEDLLEVSQPVYYDSTLHMYKCKSCGTAYFIDEDPVIGYDSEGFSHDYWMNYVQNWAGISAMLEPLLAVERPRTGDLLDVGCGFGFVPHFWQSIGYGDAYGLETSMYGHVGSEKLGINIIHSYYNEATEIQGQKFDYVFSSEVIEHVEDPEAFVNEIKVALKDDGILVLTTPSATVLTEDTSFISLLATLSPGFHYFIASANGLKDLLKKCGFEHVEVRDSGHRLFAWASHEQLPRIDEGFADWPVYLEYLEGLANSGDPHISGGALYRGVKDAFNLGMFDKVDALYPRFRDLALKQYNIDFDNIGLSQNRLRERDKVDYERFPSWLGCGLLYAGLVKKHNGAEPEVLEPIFAAAIESMDTEIGLAEQFAVEPAYFIERAKHEHKLLHAALTADDTPEPDPKHAYILRHPGDLKDEKVCVFAIYSPSGSLTDATAQYINLLSEQGFKVIACIAVKNTEDALTVSNLSKAAGIVVRENGGMDFSAWSRALKLIPECWDAERLVVTNDSVFALPGPFEGFINRLLTSTADYVALTDSYQIQYHTQSYFFMLQGAGLTNPASQEFWSRLKMYDRKTDVIKKYEMKILDIMGDFGLSHEILFPLADLFPGEQADELEKINVSHHYWEHLINSGFPFVKIELLRDNPMKLSLLHWKSVLRKSGMDIDLVFDHIAQRPRNKGVENDTRSLSHPDSRPEWRSILSDINKVRLNSYRRRKWRRENPKK
ncbi:methyltransferase domain-containing protein [uncultured Ruegeria sp.]|uniref:methyltransferase domain-containing protein n=1 Tax=uncultured Ruegeria sp. TaxID=259304 RepID=UPI002624AFF6|nr:methyltransferase domain-containing protein [uncultured Ruegeria sp.]